MILDRLASSRGLRADVTWTPLDDRWYTQLDGLSRTFAGLPIDAATAKRVSAVFACTTIIAETIASLPCVLYRRRRDGGKDRATDHRYYRMLRYRPNPFQQPMDFFGNLGMRLTMRGNGLGRLLDDGTTAALIPFNIENTVVEQTPDYRLRYQHTDPKTGEKTTLLQDEVLHARDLSADTDNLVGQARTSLAREAIAVAAAAERFVGAFFRHDATGRLLIQSKASMPNKEARDKFREHIQENYGGASNARKAMILYGDAQVTEIGKHDDAGFIVDPRKFQVADVARFWRVPGFLIGLEEKSTSWGSGMAEMKQAFVDFTLKPWTDRIAQALMGVLLTDDEREEYLIEFMFEDLLRGNLLDQMRSYQVARIIGVLNPNEIRSKLNMGPREGGDAYQEIPTGAAANASPRTTPRSRSPADEEGDHATAIPAPLLADATRRIVAAESRDLFGRMPDGGDARQAWLTAAYARKADYLAKVIGPLCDLARCDAAPLVDRLVASGVRSLAAATDADAWAIVRHEAVLVTLEHAFTPATLPAAA